VVAGATAGTDELVLCMENRRLRAAFFIGVHTLQFCPCHAPREIPWSERRMKGLRVAAILAGTDGGTDRKFFWVVSEGGFIVNSGF
jgi:hypothetical protein